LKGTVEDHVFEQIVRNLNHVGAFLQSEMEHPSCMYTLVRNDVLGYAILLYYPLAQVEELLRLIAMVFIIVAGVMTGMSVVLALYVSRNAAKPLSQVVNVLQKVSHGDFSARTDIDRKDEFGNLGLSVNDMVVRMKQLIDTNRQKEQSLRTSEIKSLMCQTNPHFIFNCLETIKWYILLGDTKEASESVVELGSLLRSSLDLGEGIITVQEEIGFIEKYLLLQKRRLGNRMRVKFEIDPDILSIRIPRFLFQPIVENAIMHGLENKMGQGELLIKCYEERSVLHVIVKDNGLGMSGELARKMSSYREMNEVTEGGTGLQNLVRRLKLYYGDTAGIRIHSTPMKGTQVNIDINLMVGL
jgi:two-component system sensor histidine kinase YesM